MKKLLCLVAVGKDYTSYISSSIKKLSKEYDLCILTSEQKSIYGVLDQEIYQEKIFTYFTKLTFPLRMALKHKRGVYYCDINRLHELNNLKVDDISKFTYIREWPIAKYFKDMEDALYWRKLVWFWVQKGYDYKDLKTIEEHSYYIPYNKNIDKLLYTIEEVKPIFEYTSILNSNPYRGIGNGEGLALAYALDKHKI